MYMEEEDEAPPNKTGMDRCMDWCAATGCKGCVTFWLATFFNIGVAVLIWNELRYVKFENSLTYITDNVKEAGCTADPELNGQLVHVSCPVTHLPDLSKAPALDWIRPLITDKEIKGSDLIWTAEMYQWSSHSRTVSSGGRTERKTVWEKKWKGLDFVDWNEHNPNDLPPNAKSGSVVGNPQAIWIGDKDAPLKGYHLSRYLRTQILHLDFAQVLRQGVEAKRTYPQAETKGYGKELEADNFYTCGHILTTIPCDGDEVIGAIRLAFQVIRPAHLSILALQHAPSAGGGERRLTEFTVKDFAHGYGEDDTSEVGVPAEVKTHPPTKLEDFDIPMGFISMSYDAEFLYDGDVSLDKMLEKLGEENEFALWLWRVGGYLMMCVPTFMLLTVGPALLVDVAGLVISDMACGGVNLSGCLCLMVWAFAWFLTLPVAMIIIGFAWILVRPLIGICLVVPSTIIICVLKDPVKKAYLKRKERELQRANMDDNYSYALAEDRD